MTPLLFHEGSILIKENSGASLVELMIGIFISAVVGFGLVVSFMMGENALLRSQSQAELHGTLANLIYDLTRDLQLADSVNIDETGMRLSIVKQAADSTNVKESVSYEVKNKELIKKSDTLEVKVIPWDKSEFDITILELDTNQIFRWCSDSLYKEFPIVDLQFVLKVTGTIGDEEQTHTLPYKTSIGIRNSGVKK